VRHDLAKRLLGSVHNHYKALVLKTDVEKFWSLRPRAQEAARNPAVVPCLIAMSHTDS